MGGIFSKLYAYKYSNILKNTSHMIYIRNKHLFRFSFMEHLLKTYITWLNRQLYGTHLYLSSILFLPIQPRVELFFLQAFYICFFSIQQMMEKKKTEKMDSLIDETELDQLTDTETTKQLEANGKPAGKPAPATTFSTANVLMVLRRIVNHPLLHR